MQWESGKLTAVENESEMGNKETTRFASFLGRSRFFVSFLDQYVDINLAEEDAFPSSDVSKSKLPLLRDLPLDPLTLCKAALCFTKLDRGRNLQGVTSTVINRIGMRLLTSRNGRLLQECPLCDLVRILEAVASSDATESRELVGHFSRKVLQHLNSLPRDEEGLLHLKGLRDCDKCTLIWALGRLGIRYSLDDSDRSAAYRRLHLLSRPRFVVRDRLSDVSIDSLCRLVRVSLCCFCLFV